MKIHKYLDLRSRYKQSGDNEWHDESAVRQTVREDFPNGSQRCKTIGVRLLTSQTIWDKTK